MNIAKVYPYYSADGTLMYEVVRFDPKSFRPRMPDGSYGLKTQRILYRLPQLNTEGMVWVCEGEKDADTLAEHGLVVTTTGAAGSWNATDTSPLCKAWGIVVVPDSDAAGKMFGNTVAVSLYAHVHQVQVMELGGPKGYDATDYINEHGIDSFVKLRSDTPRWKPERKKRTHAHIRGNKRGNNRGSASAGLPYNIDDLAWELGDGRTKGHNQVVWCPAHDDEGGTPGLSLTELDDEHTLAYCHSGCDFLEIARAVQERME